MKTHTDAMSDGARGDPAVIVSGGGSNSDLFMQIFADVFGLPAPRNVVNGGRRTRAPPICAAVATGVYPDFPRRGQEWCGCGTAFTAQVRERTISTTREQRPSTRYSGPRTDLRNPWAQLTPSFEISRTANRSSMQRSPCH